MCETTKFPFVRVPVLSNTAVLVRPSASRYTLPFMRIPLRAAAVIPPQKDRGIEITIAHGQLTTKNIRARWNQVVQVCCQPQLPVLNPIMRLGMIASARAE